MSFDLKKIWSDLKQFSEMKKEEIVGLDVGSSSVKLVHLRSGIGGYVAVAAAKADIGITEQDDERARSIKTSSAVKVCIEKTKIQTKQAVCGVCGPEVAVRPFDFPSLPPEEIRQAIMLEAEQVCPFDPGKNILEYQLVTRDSGLVARGSSDERQAASDYVQGVLVAATNDVVRSKLQMISNTSLNCALMDIDGLALVNCFCQTQPKEHGRDAHATATAILNVGHTFTNLVMVNACKPPFIRDILHGGAEIIEHIAANHQLTREAAMRAVVGGQDQQVIADIAGGAAKLVFEINESLRYYMRTERVQSIDKVLVCGGFSLVNGFAELLNRQIPFGAKLWNPFENIGRQSDAVGVEILDTAGPAMAVAAGLAMRSL